MVETSEKVAFNGQRIKLSAKVDEDFALSSYVVVRADNTEVQVEVQGNSFVMPKFDVIVTAEFKQAHNIAVENGIPHGKVMADRPKAIEGQQVTLSAEPEEGYMVERYTVYRTGNRSDTLQVNDTVFQMPDYDVTVTTKFCTALHVNVEKCENGSVQVSDSLAIPGQNIAVIVKPNKGFQLGDMHVVSDTDPNMGKTNTSKQCQIATITPGCSNDGSGFSNIKLGSKEVALDTTAAATKAAATAAKTATTAAKTADTSVVVALVATIALAGVVVCKKKH